MKPHGSFAFAALAILAVYPGHVGAEVIGPLLPRKAIEMGLTAGDIDRALEYEGEVARFEESFTRFTIRYGISTTATFSLELAGNPFNLDDEAYYDVGASIQTSIWRGAEYAITVSASYSSTLAIEPRVPKRQFDQQSLEWTLLVQREIPVRSEDLTVWLGPLISYMNVTPQAPQEEDYSESQSLLGGVVGVGLLVVDHVVMQGQLLWIDEPEYRVTLAYRF